MYTTDDYRNFSSKIHLSSVSQVAMSAGAFSHTPKDDKLIPSQGACPGSEFDPWL